MDTSSDPAASARVKASFARQLFMHTLGASLCEVAPGRVSIALPWRPDLTQQHGFVHAGAISAILDSACGYAAFSLMPEDCAVLSVEFKINLLAPAQGELFVAEAQVLKAGRTLSVCSASCFAQRAGESEARHLVAQMQATIMAVQQRPGLLQ